MNSTEFATRLEGVFKRLETVLLKKGHDYATTDVLSNFKRLSRAASILNIDVRTPVGYALFMCLMKLDRINNLVTQEKKPENESVEDSFVDNLGYTILALSLYMEKMNATEETC